MDNRVRIVTIPDLVNHDVVESVESQTAQWLLDPAHLHVFDFAAVHVIDPSFYRVITLYRRTLNKYGKVLASINLQPKLLLDVNQMGLSHVFHAVDGMPAARQLAGFVSERPAVRLDGAILQPIIDGTINTLQMQVGLTLNAGKARIKDGAEPAVAIAGIIQMNNAAMPGSIAICFPKNVFLKIYEKMVGETHDEITPDIQDAAGELLNIIYGHAKTKLKASGFAVEMAIPVIMAGEKLQMQIGEKGKSVMIPFETDLGPFYLEVYVKRNIEGA